MKPYTIAIDIGHAHGTGAAAHGEQEHDIAAAIAPHLKAHLEAFKTPEQGIHAEIVDFPDQSNSGDLAATVRYVNSKHFDAVVSLHCDFAGSREKPNPDPHGAHICYYSASGKRLAAAIASRLCQQMPGRANQTVQRTDLYILRRTNPVAVLVECGFISNPGDREWMKTHPDKVALSIALGVAEYLDTLTA